MGFVDGGGVLGNSYLTGSVRAVDGTAPFVQVTDDDAGPAEVPLDVDHFKRLLRDQASSVVVVTANGERSIGFTATSFTSVSLHPPLASFCVNRSSSSWPVIAAVPYVAVHLLAEGQERLARTFAARGIDRFAEPTRWHPGRYGVPLLDGVLTRLLCRVVGRVPAGDHSIVLVEPVHGERLDDRQPGRQRAPLLYHDGRYTAPNGLP